MKDNFLKKIEKTLDTAGFSCKSHGQTAETPYDYLSIRLSADAYGRSRDLSIMYEEVDLTMPIPGKQENKEYFVKMFTIFPFDIRPENAWEVLRMINYCNRTLPTPGIFLDEGTNKVFFRYLFSSFNKEIKDDTLISLIHMIELCMDSCSDLIEEVAYGSTMQEVVDRYLAAASK